MDMHISRKLIDSIVSFLILRIKLDFLVMSNSGIIWIESLELW